MLAAKRGADHAGSGLMQPVRTAITSESGALLPGPQVNRLGVVKVFGFAIPGIYLGATFAQKGAEFLEENDIFVPDDDDD